MEANGACTLYERVDVDLEGGAGQVQLELVDDVRMNDSHDPDSLSLHNDLRTAPGEESGIWNREIIIIILKRKD